MKKLLALLGVVMLTTNIVVAGVAIANADKKPNKTNIKTLQTELQAILDTKDDAKWEVADLQSKVDEKYNVGEITVSLDGASADKINKEIKFKFKGNDKKYTGELVLTQKYSIEGQEEIKIETLNSAFSEILATKPHEAWTAEELQIIIDEKYGANEITVSLSDPSPSEVRENGKTQPIYFIGNDEEGSNPDIKYVGQTVLTHTYIEITEIDAQTINDKITKFTNTNKDVKYENLASAQEAVKTAITEIEGITDITFIADSVRAFEETSLNFKVVTDANHKIHESENNFSVSVNLDSTKEISTIQTELQTILTDAEHKNKAWELGELQAKIDEKYEPVEDVKQITVSFDHAQFNTEIGKYTQRIKFTGNGTFENTLTYKGEVTLEHSYKVTAEISTIQTELETILNNESHNSKAWTKDEIEKELSKKEEYNGITVTPKTVLFDEENSNQDVWIFTGNANENNDYLYTGATEVAHKWTNNTLVKTTVESSLNSLVSTQMTEEEALLALTNANITGLKIKSVNKIAKAIGPMSFVVKTELQESYSWDDKNFNGEFTITGNEIGSAEKLDEVITVKDLGALDNAEDATVKAALKDKNNDLDVDAIKLTISQGDAITTTSYTVKVESNNPNIYTGEVTDVVFTVSTGSVEKLDEVITVKDLGALDNAEDATVKAALKDKNNDLDVDAIKLTISQGDAITTTSYTVKVESNNPNIYTGEVTDVVFTVSTGSVEKLDEVITVKDLGALDNAEDATVKAALKDKNNDLDVDAIKLTISQGDAITTTSYTV
ncbi:hypothetical protein, partial [Mesoplasma florum]|uniref:hypothetical protein n=1 Tax=Mesoplasma florum TaxID=2151 RepID=UPI000D1FFFE4